MPSSMYGPTSPFGEPARVRPDNAEMWEAAARRLGFKPTLLLSDLLPEHAAQHRKRQGDNDPYSAQSTNAPSLNPQQAKQAYDIYNYSQGKSSYSGLLDSLGLFGGGSGPALNAGGYLGTGLTGGASSAAAPAIDIGVMGSGGGAGPAIGDIGLGTGQMAPSMDIGTSGGLFGGKGAGAGAGAAGGATGLGPGATMTSMYGLPAAGGSTLGGTTGGAGAGGMAGLGMAALPLALFAGGMLGALHLSNKHDKELKKSQEAFKQLPPEQQAAIRAQELAYAAEEEEARKKTSWGE